MQITKKNILLSIIFIFMAYCAVDIGSMWDSGTHLSMGQNRLDYLFSLGAVNNEYWFSKFFPGISYTITAFLLNVFPKALETEVLHLINLSISLSAVYGLTNICKILFNKQISRIVFVRSRSVLPIIIFCLGNIIEIEFDSEYSAKIGINFSIRTFCALFFFEEKLFNMVWRSFLYSSTFF